MPGLDPGIDRAARVGGDRRIEPGNDDWKFHLRRKT